MILPSTILIADISGFTNFISTTSLEHSSHIINELLELIIESNTLDLTVSEVEGDAILFYKIGEAVPCDDLSNQCLSMFERFHERLKMIERDTICQCGTCQNASELGLKFVSHFGALKEISVANFKKASGLDMIVCHRLLKNDVPANEYIMISEAYRKELDQGLGCNLPWVASTQSYPDIGDVEVHWAHLNEIKGRIPDPPAKPRVVVPISEDSVSLEIDAPLFKVYGTIIDVDKKADWVVGLDDLENHTPTARVDQRHTCYFQGMGIDFQLLRGEITMDGAVYSETADFRGMPFKHQQTYTLSNTDDGGTSVRFDVNWGDEPVPPDDMKQMYVGGCAASFEVLKTMLEA
jgi:hypothetical protein